ncbi:hypothetical protein [Bradyrhizobium sp. RT5a]|uniref:hypothetical protein n=1 Tax=unclassified Bradyrhizobium TaxID=2631580 RepID=UPI003390A93D
MEIVMEDETHNRVDCSIDSEFWVEDRETPSAQNWTIGDFEAWLHQGQMHLEAFGVTFLRADIEKLIPARRDPR